ncbi:MAG: IS630 family transposase, partial [Candidatus Dormibacterales bacterium]
AVMVHLPIHASWLNQIEIYFSILQRKVLTPADTTSLAQLGARRGSPGAPCSRGRRRPRRSDLRDGRGA